MKIEEEPGGLLIQFQGIRDLVAGQKAALSTPDTKNSHCLAVDQEYDTKHSGAFAEQEGPQFDIHFLALACQSTTFWIVVKSLKCKLKPVEPSCCRLGGPLCRPFIRFAKILLCETLNDDPVSHSLVPFGLSLFLI